MIGLNVGDAIQGDAQTASIVDFTINGIASVKAKPLANGQLPDSIDDLYVATIDGESVNSIVIVNTNSSAEQINIYFTEDGGTARRLIPEDLILGVGYQLMFDGRTMEVRDRKGALVMSYQVTASAVLADNKLIRGDGGAYGIQDSGIAVDDADNMNMNGGAITNAGHGIADNQVATIDDAAAADDEFCRFTANGIEGLTVAEAITALLAETLPEDVGLILDSDISADGKYSPVYTFSGTAGAVLAFGETVYFASADSKWELTDADAEATTKPRVAIVVVGGSEDATITLMGLGYIREDDWNWTTPGAPLFLDTTTAGGLTETAPAGSGDCARVVAYVVDANTIFFNPGNDWFEIT